MSVQKVTMPTIPALRFVYYLTALGFHGALFFSNSGNFFHGGTPSEWVVMQAIAVLIVWMAIMLTPKIRSWEKTLVILCATVPAISIAWALVEAIRR